jgi:hypothetical protein
MNKLKDTNLFVMKLLKDGILMELIGGVILEEKEKNLKIIR